MDRGSGILLHVSSLPSKFGIGDLGNGAFKFADFLAKARQGYWQILPLNPTNPVYGNSPYSSFSAFGANTLLISPERMFEDGWLEKDELQGVAGLPGEYVDYNNVVEVKGPLFDAAYRRFKSSRKKSDFEKFCREENDWLNDFALFAVLKKHFHGKIWNKWPEELRDRDRNALEDVSNEKREEIEKEKFLQYVFYRQWVALKDYCNQNGIQVIGDIPIYVTDDSVDVWADPEIFKLDKEKNPLFIAGVPPDYFSKTGQLWGNPVYNWNELKRHDYAWWIKRINHNLKLFDWVRIDHFRGFVDYWQVPAGEQTAVNGAWQKAPAKDFFETLLKRFPGLPVIAEDLGILSDEVKQTMRHFKFPGMKILLFAFGENSPTHPYLPHNYVTNCVVYTGTHDNNTVRGWFEKEATAADKKRFFTYIGREVLPEEVNWEMIRLAMESIAFLAVFPIQDILNLGRESRMNLPGTVKGNWLWRLSWERLTDEIGAKLAKMTQICGRAQK